MGSQKRFASLLILLLLSLGMLPSCAGRGDGAPGTGAIRVTGRLIDAETGQAVSRRSFYIHAFNDGANVQVSLDPGEGPEFALRMEEPTVRLRVPDGDNKYELYEQVFVAKGGALDVDVRLVPTHWIRLHGRVLWRDGVGELRSFSGGDGSVNSARISVGKSPLECDSGGNYSVRVPRELLTLRAINTGYMHLPREVDLRGDLGDEYQMDVTLRKP